MSGVTSSLAEFAGGRDRSRGPSCCDENGERQARLRRQHRAAGTVADTARTRAGREPRNEMSCDGKEKPDTNSCVDFPRSRGDDRSVDWSASGGVRESERRNQIRRTRGPDTPREHGRIHHGCQAYGGTPDHRRTILVPQPSRPPIQPTPRSRVVRISPPPAAALAGGVRGSEALAEDAAKVEHEAEREPRVRGRSRWNAVSVRTSASASSSATTSAERGTPVEEADLAEQVARLETRAAGPFLGRDHDFERPAGDDEKAAVRLAVADGECRRACTAAPA